MAALGWFRADHRRSGRIRRWRHIDGWVLIPSFGPDRWGLFDVAGALVLTATMAEAISHVQQLEQQTEAHTA